MRAWLALCLCACSWTSVAAGEGGAEVARAVRANAHVLADGSYAVPLIGDPPDWYTPEVRDKALAAYERGLAYDFREDRYVAPAAAPSQVLLRPGTQIFPAHLNGGWCTAGFVFTLGGRKHISTAGHCTVVGEDVMALAPSSMLLVIGKTAVSKVPSDPDIPGDDWALIDINPMWQSLTDADVALVGGPCGTVVTPAVPVLKLVGHGTAVGAGGTARPALFESSSAAFR
ncbi:MAG: hypothetical protein ACREQ9_20480, partial [Candidatus Binatia bacterium]